MEGRGRESLWRGRGSVVEKIDTEKSNVIERKI